MTRRRISGLEISDGSRKAFKINIIGEAVSSDLICGGQLCCRHLQTPNIDGAPRLIVTNDSNLLVAREQVFKRMVLVSGFGYRSGLRCQRHGELYARRRLRKTEGIHRPVRHR